ncbi:testis-expressed basic protein 1 [Panthera pardus]|uniref:Testis-expressed basic protein 1 n=1 Tax=Panthera pardus TaxID=9691 RepID=A0A9W2VRE0_PANPR|nr:testis-expressed basic protein 1 [Panthera pardus]
MAVLEITLAVILTLLGLVILAILLTRWTRRKQNEIDVSRYSSEQSAGLLDYEDGRDFPSQRSKRGRGFRHLYSTESDTSYDDRALSQSSIALVQGSMSNTKAFKATSEPLSGSAGPITGAIGPIMQFTAPIPGGTGPIKLSQKTIVQTPGPIVQYTGPNVETSEMTSKFHTCSYIIVSFGFLQGLQSFTSVSTARQSFRFITVGVPITSVINSTSQETDTNSDSIFKPDQEISSYLRFVIFKTKNKETNIRGKVGIKRKYLISEMCTFVVCSVIFPGYTDAQVAKKSDFKAQILKNEGTTKTENSQEENKKTLKKKILFTDSDESLTLRHKTESKSKAKGIELEDGEIGMEVEKKESDTMMLGEEDQIKGRDIGIPIGEEAQVKRSESRIPQEQEAQVKMNDTGTPQGQGFQIKQSELRTQEGQGSQVENSESKIPQEQESQVEKSESEIPQTQGSQIEKSDTRIPQRQESQVKKSESRMPQAQGSQVKKESSENKGKQDKDKGDARKKKDTGENDTMKKSDEGKPKVKGKKELEVKGKKTEGSVRGKVN